MESCPENVRYVLMRIEKHLHYKFLSQPRLDTQMLFSIVPPEALKACIEKHLHYKFLSQPRLDSRILFSILTKKQNFGLFNLKFIGV